jgi:hypothetical protein
MIDDEEEGAAEADETAVAVTGCFGSPHAMIANASASQKRMSHLD